MGVVNQEPDLLDSASMEQVIIAAKLQMHTISLSRYET